MKPSHDTGELILYIGKDIIMVLPVMHLHAHHQLTGLV
jgi:hypothetical protein